MPHIQAGRKFCRHLDTRRLGIVVAFTVGRIAVVLIKIAEYPKGSVLAQ
ncbi:hypothetical protein NSU_3652 [Novosphingobium pentaromativorans US6-1]|uniref:Uncharacterized protein n=1 Tax=Novosphingobium pentaromativorans US6-1 TaxID=1088721 RepID=G6EH31_9SPHN|nr:hypothetical protein NSU_3652 [Novosphingobium pentaromativorans US6-1]